jgi:hypothetical protein
MLGILVGGGRGAIGGAALGAVRAWKGCVAPGDVN